MVLGRLSRLVNIVAPVVVSPDIDSKIAFVKDNDGISARYKGTAPNNPRTVQNAATIIKPSRNLKSFLDLLDGIHNIDPAIKVRKNPCKKATQDGS